jgi:hypothetical protein
MSFGGVQAAGNFLAMIGRESGIWWIGRINAISQKIHRY